MFVEVHLLQNFAPSCLNRDDTNSPKDCEFGGYRRARISSQCIKRAIRNHFKKQGLLPREQLSERSKLLVGEIAKRVADKWGKDKETATKLTASALASVKLQTKEDGETQYLLFLADAEIDALASLVNQHWDELVKVLPDKKGAAEQAVKTTEKKKTAKQQKSDAKDALPRELVKAVENLLKSGKAADLALFGRMLADQTILNIDAACQVAHALSTNKVSMEMDFYTAVDDLKTREEDAGAGMLGTVEFNSSCFYRYANIDLTQLHRNLKGDEELTRKTVRAFVQASVEAIPTGKQNSMAAHNPPSLVFVVVRERGLWSLANAFVQPVRPGRDTSLVVNSIAVLADYWERLGTVYGDDDILSRAVCTTEKAELGALGAHRVDGMPQIYEQLLSSITLPNPAEAK